MASAVSHCLCSHIHHPLQFMEWFNSISRSWANSRSTMSKSCNVKESVLFHVPYNMVTVDGWRCSVPDFQLMANLIIWLNSQGSQLSIIALNFLLISSLRSLRHVSHLPFTLCKWISILFVLVMMMMMPRFSFDSSKWFTQTHL